MKNKALELQGSQSKSLSLFARFILWLEKPGNIIVYSFCNFSEFDLYFTKGNLQKLQTYLSIQSIVLAALFSWWQVLINMSPNNNTIS